MLYLETRSECKSAALFKKHLSNAQCAGDGGVRRGRVPPAVRGPGGRAGGGAGHPPALGRHQPPPGPGPRARARAARRLGRRQTHAGVRGGADTRSCGASF